MKQNFTKIKQSATLWQLDWRLQMISTTEKRHDTSVAFRSDADEEFKFMGAIFQLENTAYYA